MMRRKCPRLDSIQYERCAWFVRQALIVWQLNEIQQNATIGWPRQRIAWFNSHTAFMHVKRQPIGVDRQFMDCLTPEEQQYYQRMKVVTLYP